MDGRNKRVANAPHVGREGAAQSPLDEGGVAITCGMLKGGLLRALAQPHQGGNASPRKTLGRLHVRMSRFQNDPTRNFVGSFQGNAVSPKCAAEISIPFSRMRKPLLW